MRERVRVSVVWVNIRMNGNSLDLSTATKNVS